MSNSPGKRDPRVDQNQSPTEQLDPEEVAARVGAGEPVAVVLGLKPPSLVAKEALNRERAAARAKGLYPGKVQHRSYIEPQRSGSRKDARDPRLLGDALGKLLVQRGWNQDVAVGGVIGRWPEIAGPEISQHCTAESFENSVLTVRAATTAWATQLRFLSPELIAAVAKQVGPDVVKEIKILAPDAPKFSRGKYSVKGRGPRDTWG
ncbi:DciA family protein [Jonesiaceae bacterium BS-20]|uniref:DciA family protein n=1 Tax=Jonesiaceae bacterium BS-20 TaxID=3120821 RepID=A0AAU7DWE1_9MICO